MAATGRGQRVPPAETTTFVGRRAELAQLGGLLRHARLVTLTGVGGVGKTRLALRAADQARAAFPDGVWLVELSPLRDPDLLGQVVLQALPLGDQTTRPAVDVLLEWLEDKRLLLVLDTCEHLAEECSRLASVLLEAAPGLCVLATSRQILDLPNEHDVAVLPLPAEEPGHSAGACPSDAVMLFVQRATAAAPGFALDAGNQERVAGICRYLDGIPLAIELAAARLGELSLDELGDRLHARFELLTAPDADAGLETRPARHQTLRTTIGWSHELCSPLERLLWSRLSVFADGFDAEAVGQVCGGGPLPTSRIPQLLKALADKSIIEGREDPVSGLVRYRLLDTIRDYGRHWLRELGEEEELRRLHRGYYSRLAWRGEAGWIGPDQVAWYERIVAELANLRKVLDGDLAGPDGRAALELAGSLWFFWYCCGYQREGRGYLERALAVDTGPSRARTRALWACAMVANAQGDITAALRLGTACREGARAQGDRDGVRAAAHPIGMSLARHGELAEAVTVVDQVPPAPGHGGYQEAARLGIRALRAMLHIQMGEFARGAAVAEEVRAECQERGEQWMRALADWTQALADLKRGDADLAAAHARASLEGKWRLHDTNGMALAVELLASAAAAQGKWTRAARLLGLGQQIWQTIGRPQMGAAKLCAAHEACERRVREAIGDAAYEKTYRAGVEMDPDRGVFYALTASTAHHRDP